MVPKPLPLTTYNPPIRPSTSVIAARLCVSIVYMRVPQVKLLKARTCSQIRPRHRLQLNTIDLRVLANDPGQTMSTPPLWILPATIAPFSCPHPSRPAPSHAPSTATSTFAPSTHPYLRTWNGLYCPQRLSHASSVPLRRSSLMHSNSFSDCPEPLAKARQRIRTGNKRLPISAWAKPLHYFCRVRALHRLIHTIRSII